MSSDWANSQENVNLAGIGSQLSASKGASSLMQSGIPLSKARILDSSTSLEIFEREL